MKYLIMCPKLRHKVEADDATPINRNDKVKCFANCPKKDSCPHFANGEFAVLGTAKQSSGTDYIKLVKKGERWEEGSGPAPSNPAPQQQPQQQSTTFRPFVVPNGFNANQTNQVEPARQEQSAQHNPAPSGRPTFSFGGQNNGGVTQNSTPTPPPAPAREEAPAPAPQAPSGRPTFSFGTQNSTPQPAPSNPEPAPANNDNAGGSSFFSRPSNPAPQPNPAPANNNQPSGGGFFSQPSQSGNSLRDSLNSRLQNNNATPVVDITRGVTVSTYKQVRLGGKLYSDDFALLRNKTASPLPALLNEIRWHWQTNFVFEDPHTLTKEFIWLLLKLNVLPAKNGVLSEILKATMSENPDSDKNSKFFYLMQNAFPSNTNNGFYFAEAYSYSRLVPLFYDINDYINLLFRDDLSGQTFRAICQSHLPEVMYYLHYTDKWPTRENKDTFREELQQKLYSLLDDFVIRHYESTGRFVYLLPKGDAFVVQDLGSYDNFIQSMQFPQDINVSRAMMAFLKRFRITNTKMLLTRDATHPLMESSAPQFEGSSVYIALGLSSPAYYLEEYSLFCIMLKEYIDTFDPDDISINGVIYLSKRGFINEVRQILLEACQAAFAHDMPNREDYINKALLLYSLIERGVVAHYASINQSQNQYRDFLNVFAHLAANDLSVEEYTNIFKKDALFYLDGESLNPHAYLLKCITNWEADQIVDRIRHDAVLALYVKDDKETAAKIDKKIQAYKTTFARFN